MQTKPMDGQVSIFDLDLPSGRTCREPFQATRETTSAPSLKPSRPSVKTTYQFLDLRSGIPGGGILGNGWSIAWRVYDAQYWGVPQRRKRIYLVADFGSERAVEILSECEGVRWNAAAGGEAWQRVAANAEGSTGRSGGLGIAPKNSGGYRQQGLRVTKVRNREAQDSESG